MLKPGGYFISTDPDPRKGTGQTAVIEMDSVTCGHGGAPGKPLCGKIILVPPLCKPEDMPFEQCWGCRRYICRDCAAEMHRTLKCDVIENKIERIEAADRFRREVSG